MPMLGAELLKQIVYLFIFGYKVGRAYQGMPIEVGSGGGVG